MPNVTPESLVQSLHWRYATKKFDPSKKIAPALWETLEQAALLAPSSYGLQPWRFYVIDSPEIRTRLRAVSWNQPQITDASHLVVFARRSTMTPADIQRHIDRIIEVRKTPAAALDGLKNAMLGSIASGAPGFDAGAWAGRQAYIALGVFLSAAAMLGIDACPMEGFEAPKYDEILGLPAQGYTAQVLAAAGYRAADDAFAAMPKVRFDRKDVIHHV